MEALQKRRVLLVDDESEILTALEDLLEESYEVISTTSPKHALELLARMDDVAVIISDQRMPEMTGDQFLAQARGVSKAQAILLTGYADINAVISAVNTGGVVGYVHKPWDPELLRAIVANAADRYRLGRELALERALLQGLLESSGEAVSFKDAAGRFVRLNALKADSLGAEWSACLGRSEADFVDAARAETIARHEAQVIEGRKPVVETEDRVSGDDPARYFSVNRFPILDEQDQVSHVVTIERDITEQRLMEDRLRQSDKMQALGTLAGGVAHDFNNLLMAILGSLELAQRRMPQDERVSRYLDNAIMAGKRGAALTQRLLSFSRRKDLATQAVDVNRLVADMDELLERTLGGVVKVTLQAQDNLWSAEADPDQVELAILNLCINARDAMNDGGIITIATRNMHVEDEISDLAPGDFVVVSVTDTGTGMTEQVLRRALEPFFSTKAGKGTGLGLSMVYGLMTQLGGTVRIDSREGRGTKVELYLPRGQSALEAQETVAAPEIAKTQAARILLVDDDEGVREVTAAYLADLGHSLMEAADGPSALAILDKERPFDLLIADFAMPGMTGLDLARQTRAKRPKLPILLVTGHADMEETPEQMAVLVKPFQQAELAARIAELLRP
ncbi:response regulator [Rhodoligotrophos appendicifer]|nr:response regulator [Rhodoligotrophos appendicifer]